jgi:hypothetical protein
MMKKQNKDYNNLKDLCVRPSPHYGQNVVYVSCYPTVPSWDSVSTEWIV